MSSWLKEAAESGFEPDLAVKEVEDTGTPYPEDSHLEET